MLSDLPEELRSEVRHIGRIRVHRHMRWVANLLEHEIEPRQIIERLIDRGFSCDLAEWIVYGLRPYVEERGTTEGQADDFVEPSTYEVVARAIFAVVLVVFFGVIGEL